MAGKSRFSIFGEIRLIDRVSGPMKRASRSVTDFSQKANKSINRVAGRGAQAGMIGLSVGAGLVAREFVKFDDAIFGATARFKAALPAGTDMTKVMEQLRKTARKVGSETQFTSAQAAAGLNKFALAGFKPVEAMASLRSIIDLTTATGEDFTRVTDISTDLLGSFGLAAQNSAKKVESLKQMNSLLAVATLSANVTMEDLFESLKKSAPIATKAGIAMKDIIAATAVLGSAGIKGTAAGTAMMNMFTRLASPTADVQKAFKLLHLRQEDFITSSGKIKNVAAIFDAIAKKTKGMTKVATLAIFDKIFGKRAIAGAAVLSKNIGEIRKMMIRMGKDPQKVLQQTANFMRKSMGNRLKILGSAATELGFKIFNAFAGKGRAGLDKLTKTIQNFDVTPIVEGLKLIFSILGFIGRNLNIIIPLFIGFKVAMFAASIAATAFGVALGATGIGLIIIGVALLITYFMHLKKETGSMSGAFKQLGLDILKWLMWPLMQVLQLIKLNLFVLSKLPGAVGRFGKSGLAGIAKVENLFNVDRVQQSGQSGGGGGAFGGLAAGVGSVFASPNSQGVNNNTTTKGIVDINVNDPNKNATTSKSGTFPPGSSLFMGVQN